MISEATTSAPIPIAEVPARPPKKGKENLKQRAYLNSLSSMIDYAGTQITGFIINPFIVSGLGSMMYGVWQMLGQMTGYAKMADTRATQVLKWSIAGKRSIATEEEFKSDVTTAMIVTAISLPFSLLIGGVISWYAPVITRANPEYFSLIRITCALLILCLSISKFFDLFEAVLGGMNLGYKRMGFRAGIVVVGGALKVLVIVKGYGLVGLSLVQILVSIITGVTFYSIVKKQVPWFGFGKTSWSKVKSFGKLSGWYMAFTTLKIIMLSTDKVILGYLAGPIYASKYAITMFTSTAVQGAVVTIITGVTPGLSSLYGKQDYAKVRQARLLIMTLSWLLCASIGATILLLNKSFVNLWMSKHDLYAGNIENLLILLVAIQVIFFQIDSYIINATLNMPRKVFYSTLAAIATLTLSFLLVGEFKVIGLCVSMLVGRLFYTFGFPALLKQQMGDRYQVFSSDLLRPVVACVALFAAATTLGYFIDIRNWIMLLAAGAVALAVSGFLYWTVGIASEQRLEIKGLFGKIKFFNFK